MRHLGMGGIAEHDLTHQVQLGQLLASGGDFIAALGHQRRTQPAAGAIDGAERLQVGVADFLAVDNHQAVLHRPQDLLLPQQEHPLQEFGVHGPEHALKSGPLRSAYSVRVRVQTKFQRPQLRLGKRGGVIRQVFIAFGNAAEGGHGDERQHAGNRIS